MKLNFGNIKRYPTISCMISYSFSAHLKGEQFNTSKCWCTHWSTNCHGQLRLSPKGSIRWSVKWLLKKKKKWNKNSKLSLSRWSPKLKLYFGNRTMKLSITSADSPPVLIGACFSPSIYLRWVHSTLFITLHGMKLKLIAFHTLKSFQCESVMRFDNINYSIKRGALGPSDWDRPLFIPQHSMLNVVAQRGSRWDGSPMASNRRFSGIVQTSRQCYWRTVGVHVTCSR